MERQQAKSLYGIEDLMGSYTKTNCLIQGEQDVHLETTRTGDQYCTRPTSCVRSYVTVSCGSPWGNLCSSLD